MVKIGIIARSSYDEDGISSFLLRGENMRKAIINSGGIPFLLLPQENISYKDYVYNNTKVSNEVYQKSMELLKLCDGIVIPGGDEWTYLDILAIKYAKENNIPILAICLGMQVMGIDGNKNNLKRIDNDRHKSTEKYVHKVKIEKDTLLYKILEKEEIYVNSRHYYEVITTPYSISGKSKSDGIIEAIEEKSHPFFLGLEWHPEDIYEYDINSRKIFDAFINSCKIQKKVYNSESS